MRFPDAYAHLDAAYLLGALDPAERDEYELHLASCAPCRAGLAEISPIPQMLAGLDESAFAEGADPPVTTPSSAPLDAASTTTWRTVARQRLRRRWITAAAGLAAAACAAALIVVTLPGDGTKPAPRAMTALQASPISATVALQPKKWGTEIDLTCWSRPGSADVPPSHYVLVAHGTDGRSYELGSWRLESGYKITFVGGTALAEGQIDDLTIDQPDGTPILKLIL